MVLERSSGYEGPSEKVDSMVLSAIRRTYFDLPPREKVLIDGTIQRIRTERIKDFGRRSILEYLAKLDMLAQGIQIPKTEEDLQGIAKKGKF